MASTMRSPTAAHPIASKPKALLKVGYRCNNACLFCHSAPHRGQEATSQDVLDKIQRCHQAGVELVAFSGGEPTIRRELPSWAEAVRRGGALLGLVTNGRMLAYPALRKRLLHERLAYLQVSLAGAEASTHDAAVRVPGAFHETLTGLQGILSEAEGAPFLSTVNVVVTRSVADSLDALGETLQRLGSAPRASSTHLRLKLSALEPEGEALRYTQEIALSLEKAGEACQRFATRWREPLKSRGVTLGFEGFPHCYLGPHAGLEMDLWTDRFVFMSEAFEPELHPIDDNHRRRFVLCHRCSHDGCVGAFHRHTEPLHPSQQRRSNCVLFAPSSPSNASLLSLGERFPLEDPRDCPIYRGQRPRPDPFSELLAADEKGWRLWTSASKDFRARRLHLLKDRSQQIYVAGAAAARRSGPELFRALRKLEKAPMCRHCPHGAVCGGAFTSVEGDVIEEASQTLARLTASLQGRWLDVGSGAMPYAASKSEQLELVGLDPCGERAHVKGVAEELPFQDESFDGVLCVRSLPHLRDPLACMRELRRVLRPGGSLHLISDTLYGLLVPAPPPTKKASPGYQHFRNPTPTQVKALLHDTGFTLSSSSYEPPGPRTANLVLVTATRPPARVPHPRGERAH